MKEPFLQRNSLKHPVSFVQNDYAVRRGAGGVLICGGCWCVSIQCFSPIVFEIAVAGEPVEGVEKSASSRAI